MLKRTCVCLAVLWIVPITATPVEQLSSVPSCRHDQKATQEDRNRRAQAVTLAKAINAAETELVRRTREYQPLANLRNLPAVPGGFKLNLYADRDGYIFSVKDTLDPCWFAVFSDSTGLLYEKAALSAPLIAQ